MGSGESPRKGVKESFRFAFPKAHSRQVGLRRMSGSLMQSLRAEEERGRQSGNGESWSIQGKWRSSLFDDWRWEVAEKAWHQDKPSVWQLQSPQNSSQKCSMELPPQHSWSSSLSKEVSKEVMEVPSHSLYQPSSTSINVSAGNYWVQSSQILITLIWNS